MHVIPSCEIPSFCTTDASSHTGNARLEPHIGNAGESVAGNFHREKSGDVAPAYPGSYRPRIRTGYVAFFQETSRIARRLRIREERCRV